MKSSLMIASSSWLQMQLGLGLGLELGLGLGLQHLRAPMWPRRLSSTGVASVLTVSPGAFCLSLILPASASNTPEPATVSLYSMQPGFNAAEGT